MTFRSSNDSSIFLASIVNALRFGVKQAGCGVFLPARFGGQWGWAGPPRPLAGLAQMSPSCRRGHTRRLISWGAAVVPANCVKDLCWRCAQPGTS
jgi:hypothetical protein